MARPSPLTPTLQKAVLLALRRGNTETAAAQYAGVDYSTYRRWKKRDAEFRLAIQQAQTEAQMAAVARVRGAMGEHWQAAAWWLERRHPAEWSKQVNVRVVLTAEAERLADELGLDKAAALAEVDRLLADAAAP